MRIDRVIRVPVWASNYIRKGDLVSRYDARTVYVRTDMYKGALALSESYTKFLDCIDTDVPLYFPLSN
jgi:hypothetical protein